MEALEGIATVKNLAHNMAFLIKAIALGKDKYGMPEKEEPVTSRYENVIALRVRAQKEAAGQNCFSGELHAGMSGLAVSTLNCALKERGLLDESGNGVFTEKTRAAVERFQTENGLDVTGMVTADTFSKIVKKMP